jgi:hypothetical protein
MSSTTIIITNEQLSSSAAVGFPSEDIGDNKEGSPLRTQRVKKYYELSSSRSTQHFSTRTHNVPTGLAICRFDYEYYRSEHFQTPCWESQFPRDAHFQNYSAKNQRTTILVLELKDRVSMNTSIVVRSTLVFVLLKGRP